MGPKLGARNSQTENELYKFTITWILIGIPRCSITWCLPAGPPIIKSPASLDGDMVEDLEEALEMPKSVPATPSPLMASYMGLLKSRFSPLGTSFRPISP